jgi:hypothetical protein
LPKETLDRLKKQLMAPQWDLVGMVRRVEEKKTKEKIGRSPDDADALNLAYYDGLSFVQPRAVDTRQGLAPLYGRGQHARPPEQEPPRAMTPGGVPITGVVVPADKRPHGIPQSDERSTDDGPPGGVNLFRRALRGRG